jgi:integrase
MSRVEHYLLQARRENTERSVAAAVRHYELEWRGLLPATPQSIAAYLAHYASTQSISTLRVRLAALGRWHREQGFADPTKSDLVRRVLKGIRSEHNTPQKQARPMAFDELARVEQWLLSQVRVEPPATSEAASARLRAARDRSMLLLGFWRGFRADELTSLRFEHVRIEPDGSMQCFLAASKTDTSTSGRSFRCPSLPRHCPVAAFRDWQTLSGLQSGAVYRQINRWGGISERRMQATSVIPWLRRLLAKAGADMPDQYSSHSLRRGFANWARTSGWDLKELMGYVGWKDMHAAMRYLEVDAARSDQLFAQSLGTDTEPADAAVVPQAAPSERSSPKRSNVVPLRPRKTSP